MRAPAIEHPIHLRLRTSDVSLYKSIILEGEYSLGNLTIYPRVIVDAGANCGLPTIFFANKYHGAKIIAVEPEESNYEILLRNIAPYPNITPVQAALWDHDGVVNLGGTGLDDLEHGRWAFAVTPDGPTKVRALTMQTLMRETGIQSIDLLKMDIEGGEKETFTNADWAKSVRVLLIELHDHIKSGCREVVGKAMHDCQIFERGEMTIFVRAGELSPSLDHYFAAAASGA